DTSKERAVLTNKCARAFLPLNRVGTGNSDQSIERLDKIQAQQQQTAGVNLLRFERLKAIGSGHTGPFQSPGVGRGLAAQSRPFFTVSFFFWSAGVPPLVGQF